MKSIQVLNKTSFYLETEKSKMLLIQRKTFHGLIWEMHIDNPSRRLCNSLGVKEFDSLKEVEKRYKDWAGVTSLINKST